MPSVLVIDDEPGVREALERVLTRAGFEVRTAADGVAGVDAYLAQATDIVVVDIMMPHRDGIDVIRRIRERAPGTRILAISGGGDFGPFRYRPEAITTDAYLTLAARTGADAVMTKPFRRHEIVAMVRSLVSH
ncbi:MAG: response regulator [Proteobacteria bacterium]|nr:response regulator [Pseudomonadota bacterium]